MQGNILSCYPVILPSQVILLSDVTSVSEFHMQGNILLVSGFPAIRITLADNITLWSRHCCQFSCSC